MAFLGGERLKPKGNTLLSFGFLSIPVSSFLKHFSGFVTNYLD